jgi:uncharacterized protein YndB with AHSA1/START domain
MKRWLIRGLGGIVGIVVLLLGIGFVLPVAHVASETRTIDASQEQVWAIIADPDGMAAWRPDVDRVDRLPDRGGLAVWREVGPGGTLTFETDAFSPPSRMVTRIADEGIPFGGSWTYDLVVSGTATELTITENGEVCNVVFRLVSKFIIGHDATLIAYLDALESHVASAGGGA